MRAASTKSWLRIWPPKGGLPLRCGQAGSLGEGLPADDGVVAPVVAFGAAQPGEAAADHRPVDAARELLKAGEDRASVDEARDGLDEAGIGIGLHAADEVDDRLRLDQAVGVEHQQVIVGAAPAPAEIGDVAGLAADVAAAPAIEGARARSEPRPQLMERRLLGQRHGGIGGVAEDEPVEAGTVAETLDAGCHGLDRGEDPVGVFVVAGHEHRRPAGDRPGGLRRGRTARRSGRSRRLPS